MGSDDPFDDVFDAIERLVEDLFGDGPSGAVERDVPVEITERGGAVEVVADLPAMTADDVDVRCDGRTVAIEAAGVSEQIDLPVPVDETSGEASLNNGVLSVAFEPTDDDATVDVA